MLQFLFPLGWADRWDVIAFGALGCGAVTMLVLYIVDEWRYRRHLDRMAELQARRRRFGDPV